MDDSWDNGKLVKMFGQKMKKEQRKVLLFLDNAPSHPNINFENVKLQFLPPNTTCKTQPMDQGIIQTLKLKYRKRQLAYLLDSMEKFESMTGPQILKTTTILDAIYRVYNCWTEIETSTIEKCFKMCGFDKDAIEEFDIDDEYDNIPLSILKLSRDVFDCDFKELVTIDKQLMTCNSDMTNWDRPATELIEGFKPQMKMMTKVMKK
jgi:hypothetical protein